ncbi:MAG TPA: hypothetical protein VM580_18620, partial [Labilithrix sp.]|nr:hypothetical protein [Labilithrix sp.]
VIDLDAPSSEVVGDLRELLFLAAFCESGDASLETTRFEATCTSGSPARLASATIRLASAGPNNNPEVATDAVIFDGMPMANPAAAPSASCADEPNAPVVAPGTKHRLGLRFRGDERESSPDVADGLENILASHVVTAGKLERQYSMFEPREAAPKEVSVEWTAPPLEQVAQAGRLVSLYVVLRDGRGGTAFVRRAICTRP